MAITSGNENIRVQHEQARALNQQKVDAAKEASTAEKNEAVSIMNEAWGKVGSNDSENAQNSLGGAISEGVQDIWGALTASGTAGLEIIEDAATQVGQEIADGLSDLGDSIDEGFDLAGNTLTNIGNGLRSVGNFLFGGIRDAFEEGTLVGHEDEQA